MAGLVTVTEPTIEPVSRIEAREHLRLDDDVDDAQVRAYITAARVYVENFTGRLLINRTMRQYLDGARGGIGNYWEGTRQGPSLTADGDFIEIAASPVVSVSSIKYYDDADTEYTWNSANYYVDTAQDVGRVVLRDGGVFPTDLRAANGLEINFTAGYGTSPTNIPEAIRVAVLQMTTFFYEHRGDFERFPPPKPPAVTSALLQPYRMLRFGTHPFSKMMKTGIG